MTTDEITYKVSIYDKLDVYKGKKRTTYYVRWRVNDREWKVPFHHAGQAGTFRSSLVTAAKQGGAFQYHHRPPGLLATRRARVEQDAAGELVHAHARLHRSEVEVRLAKSPPLDRRSTHRRH